jgi:H+-transporting ATPase
MFFFVIVMVYDWALPPRLLILICILNDLATLVIAVDNAQISQRPDKWRIGQLIFLSVVLGALLTGFSFAHFFFFREVYGYKEYISIEGGDSDPSIPHVPEEDKKIDSIMYLHISSAPHFVIFSTRLAGYFWENLPSPLFTVVIIGTQIVALLMVIFGGLTPKVPAGQAIVVLIISFVIFILLDIVKVQIFKYWSFEFTAKAFPTPARRAKSAARKAKKIQQERVWNSINTVRQVAVKTAVLEALRPNNNSIPSKAEL